jgi:hypothetical protein
MKKTKTGAGIITIDLTIFDNTLGKSIDSALSGLHCLIEKESIGTFTEDDRHHMRISYHLLRDIQRALREAK